LLIFADVDVLRGPIYAVQDHPAIRRFEDNVRIVL
jgi:hypothetical protein